MVIPNYQTIMLPLLWTYNAHEIMRFLLSLLNLFNGVVKIGLIACWINTSKVFPAFEQVKTASADPPRIIFSDTENTYSKNK